jgi:hypothetical protein
MIDAIRELDRLYCIWQESEDDDDELIYLRAKVAFLEHWGSTGVAALRKG